VKLIVHARGALKATGHRLKACSTRSFTQEAGPTLPEELKETMAPVSSAIDALSPKEVFAQSL
jgi:hypothetical protein